MDTILKNKVENLLNRGALQNTIVDHLSKEGYDKNEIESFVQVILEERQKDKKLVSKRFALQGMIWIILGIIALLSLVLFYKPNKNIATLKFVIAFIFIGVGIHRVTRPLK
jgi:NADH:ubiquinone oxidoreductase subunit 3 (subunit A)